MGEPRPVIYSIRPQQGSSKSIEGKATNNAGQPIIVTLANPTSIQQLKQQHVVCPQQQQVLVTGQPLQTTSLTPKPVYVNLGATTTCSQSNVQTVHSLQQQGSILSGRVNIKKPVVLNLSHNSNLNLGANVNQPSSINLPIGTRLVVSSAAASNQQISFSTAGTRILTACSKPSSVLATSPSATSPRFSSPSLAPRTVTINVPATLTPAGRGGSNLNKGILAPRIIGTVGRPIMNIGAYRPPLQNSAASSSGKNFVTLRHQVTPKSISVEAQAAVNPPDGFRLSYPTSVHSVQPVQTYPTSVHSVQDASKVINISGSKQQPIVLNQNNLITNPDGTKSLIIQRGGTKQLVKLQPVQFPGSKGMTKLPGKLSPTTSKSNPTQVLNVVGAKLHYINTSIANTLPENKSSNQQEECDEAISEEANETDDKSMALDLSMVKIQSPVSSVDSRRVNATNVTVSNDESQNSPHQKVLLNQKTYRFSLDTRCKDLPLSSVNPLPTLITSVSPSSSHQQFNSLSLSSSATSIINRVSLPVTASSQFHQPNKKATENAPSSIQKQNVSIQQTNNVLSASANQTTVTKIVSDSVVRGLNKNVQQNTLPKMKIQPKNLYVGSQIRIQGPQPKIHQLIVPSIQQSQQNQIKLTNKSSPVTSLQSQTPRFVLAPQPTSQVRESAPQTIPISSLIPTSKCIHDSGKLGTGNQIIKAANGQQYLIRNATILPRSGCPTNLPPGGQVIQLATPINAPVNNKIDIKSISSTSVAIQNEAVQSGKAQAPNVIHINIPTTSIRSLPASFNPSMVMPCILSQAQSTFNSPNKIGSSREFLKDTPILNPASLKGLKPVPKHVLANSSFSPGKNPLTDPMPPIPVTMTNFRIMPSPEGKIASQFGQTVVTLSGSRYPPSSIVPSNSVQQLSVDSRGSQVVLNASTVQGQSPIKIVLPINQNEPSSSTAPRPCSTLSQFNISENFTSSKEQETAKVLTNSLNNMNSQMVLNKVSPSKRQKLQDDQIINQNQLLLNCPSRHPIPQVVQISPVKTNELANIAANNTTFSNQPLFKVPTTFSPSKSTSILIHSKPSTPRELESATELAGQKVIISQEHLNQGFQFLAADGSIIQPGDLSLAGSSAQFAIPAVSQPLAVPAIAQQSAINFPAMAQPFAMPYIGHPLSTPVNMQTPVNLVNSQILGGQPSALSSNILSQIKSVTNPVAHGHVQGGSTQTIFSVTKPQMNLIPLTTASDQVRAPAPASTPVSMLNFVPVTPGEVFRQVSPQPSFQTIALPADVQTLVFPQNIQQLSVHQAPSSPITKQKKSRSKKHKESLKNKVQKLENALNVQHITNIMSTKGFHRLDDRVDIPEDLENDYLDALEEECSGVEINQDKLDLYKKFYNHAGSRNHVRYINASNLETYLDRSMLDNKKYLHSLLRKHIKLKGSREEVLNGKSSSSGKIKSERKERRKRAKESKLTYAEIKTRERRKLWAHIVKKEIVKSSRARSYMVKEKVAVCKKLSTACLRTQRQKEAINIKIAREKMWKEKKLAKEIQAYWKKSEREEKQQKRAQERVEQEQRKLDIDFLEAKRQQRKLNFLITQTELYAHFMSGKLSHLSGHLSDGKLGHLSGHLSDGKLGHLTGQLSDGNKGQVVEGQGEGQGDEGQEAILSRLDSDVTDERLKELDYYNEDEVKAAAISAVKSAARNQEAAKLAFDKETTGRGSFKCDTAELKRPSVNCKLDTTNLDNMSDSAESAGERPQPSIFQGTLKSYQLKGMNWLCTLYDQGINGILADEMGLGKTVQSLAFLASIAETYGIWGPFLVITPASTLHNWQQELHRFLPDFKTIPYWGSPQERKVLRGFWSQDNLHTVESSFHIVITSYQIVISDFKYFNKQSWQYMVLDEAQAIKSANSQRWKMLLEFKCRGRLLLSGTPIQNSMAELWSLLHFVMPSLFDSHNEFKEWFSKDIEVSAADGSRGGKMMDEKQMSRLHMILKPFMLRRIKKDVENELTDKVEILIYCPLTIRQKLLYAGLKENIRIEEVLAGLGLGSGTTGVNSLMNLVMQFRKVCNHPELFERREPKSPLCFPSLTQHLPRLVVLGLNPPNHVAQQPRHSIFQANKVQRQYLEVNDHAFDFLRLTNLTAGELEQCTWSLYHRWILLLATANQKDLSSFSLTKCSFNSDLVFTSYTSSFLSHWDVKFYSMPETVAHRIIRSKHLMASKHLEEGSIPLVEELTHTPRPPELRPCQRVECPRFLLNMPPAVSGQPSVPECHSRTAEYRKQDHERVWVGPGKIQTAKNLLLTGQVEENTKNAVFQYIPEERQGLTGSIPVPGWSRIVVPDKNSLICDAGKLMVLDGLLTRLKEEGHRVLIYTQMTKMIDLLEEFMSHRQHSYMRLDGSSKIHQRRDMVADFQNRKDIFVFLLSTRAGGLGINLTAADTVIFYDSDWNPTVDQQAMDRAHRLGQTKQVTVYRLICKGTIEDRILQRAREKSEIHNLVIQGGSFKGKSDLKTKEVVSLLLDDDELERNMARASNSNNDGGKQLPVKDDDIGGKQLIKLEDDISIKEGNLKFHPLKKRKKCSKITQGGNKKFKNSKMEDGIKKEGMLLISSKNQNGMVHDSNSLNF